MHVEQDPPIKSTATSLDVIETVHEMGGATLPEVVERFEKPRSTVHDHLKTLTEAGYLVKDDRTFRVSVRFLNLGGRARADSQFFQVAEGEVRQLASDTGEHANLMIEENGRGIFLYKVKGSRSVNLDTYEGMEVDLHTTAMGKAILAWVSEAKRDAIIEEHGLEPVTSKTVTDRDELEEELEAIRERGYAIDNEERVEGVRCVAAPIVTDDRVVGAVSVSAPKSRMNGERFEETIPSEVLSTANIIEVNLQHA
ncbi:IclR family transcriptional regulator [Halosimplex aquaticum]|uniref:IclR family transcriptional regulator n=1 Tax=Halosimplex aquaticum TaxID=3026162 RepID=A0ABD5Y8T4_9EURY|nr:IclR family transcriptional regulator [Halosimplex aquaticum]